MLSNNYDQFWLFSIELILGVILMINPSESESVMINGINLNET